MVSGVIAAEANNNYGTVGVAYGATIVGSRIGTPPGSATTSALLQGIYHAAQRRNKGGGGADVINLSYAGTSFSAPHVAALAALYIQKAAMDKGVLESELCNPNRVKTFVSPGQIKTAIMRGAVLPPGNRGEMQRRFGTGIINVKNTLGL
ncbi:hypothetical protein HYH03_019095 [Edaphochlamys debaryana]|uniref:Peptidase S8/S53 domain-containing protein n=1 Tax=Edaphochlamys debaryana TaxID=47281 RepID=A0A835XE16_9CHLO|nr:hypothetical protein HYH03_019095 [Edaphochlamys debaryana]|eukprot:KAG2481951.1 hypothetical protein HYH03_019095 [Edaphochlamys debaryana]